MKAEFIKAKTKVDGSGTGVAKYLSTNNFSVINFVANSQPVTVTRSIS